MYRWIHSEHEHASDRNVQGNSDMAGLCLKALKSAIFQLVTTSSCGSFFTNTSFIKLRSVLHPSLFLGSGGSASCELPAIKNHQLGEILITKHVSKKNTMNKDSRLETSTTLQAGCGNRS